MKKLDYRTKRNTNFKETHKSFVELQLRLKIKEEKLKMKHSKLNYVIYKKFHSKGLKRNYFQKKTDVYHFDNFVVKTF